MEADGAQVLRRVSNGLFNKSSLLVGTSILDDAFDDLFSRLHSSLDSTLPGKLLVSFFM